MSWGLESMAARGHLPSVFENHSVLATSSLRHDPAPAFSQHFIIKHKIAMQSTEIEKLVLENERLAASHGSLHHELVATQQEVQRIQGYILEIQTENEFETKGLQISKMEADIQAGENLKKELQRQIWRRRTYWPLRWNLILKFRSLPQIYRRPMMSLKVFLKCIESLKVCFKSIRYYSMLALNFWALTIHEFT